MSIPRSFSRRGRRFDRVTIRFTGGPLARQSRALVHDAVIRAHGLRATYGLTDDLAVAGGQFQLPMARDEVSRLKGRLKILVLADRIKLWVRGERFEPRR